MDAVCKSEFQKREWLAGHFNIQKNLMNTTGRVHFVEKVTPSSQPFSMDQRPLCFDQGKPFDHICIAFCKQYI